HAAHQRVCELMRLAIGEVVNPQVTGSGWSGVVIKQPRIIASERRRSARCVVDPFGKGQGTRLSRCDVKEVNVGVAIYVRAVGKKLAVGRETLTRDFPLVVRQ